MVRGSKDLLAKFAKEQRSQRSGPFMRAIRPLEDSLAKFTKAGRREEKVSLIGSGAGKLQPMVLLVIVMAVVGVALFSGLMLRPEGEDERGWLKSQDRGDGSESRNDDFDPPIFFE